MRRLTALLLATVVMACGAPGRQLRRERVSGDAEAIFNGYTHADVKCYACHGGDARGTSWGPDLEKRVPRLTDAALRDVIANGHDEMPAFGKKLTGAEIESLAIWLRGRFGGA